MSQLGKAIAQILRTVAAFVRLSGYEIIYIEFTHMTASLM